MTTTEILLTILTSLFAAKEVWSTIRNVKNKDTEIALAKINKDEEDIEDLSRKNSDLEKRLSSIDKKYNEIKTALTILYPSFQKIMQDDPAQKATLTRLYKLIST